jgi:hypothetical protein
MSFTNVTKLAPAFAELREVLSRRSLGTWRTGRSVGRTIYVVGEHDGPLTLFGREEDAAAVVAGMNAVGALLAIAEAADRVRSMLPEDRDWTDAEVALAKSLEDYERIGHR